MNLVFYRWKNHYFKPDVPEQPSEMPSTIIKTNDKKMRRLYEKCRTMLDNIPYLRMSIWRKKFRKEFPNDAKIDSNFIHMLGQWTALVSYLWSISNSSAEGYNSTMMRNLMVVLTALLENTEHISPNENILLR